MDLKTCRTTGTRASSAWLSGLALVLTGCAGDLAPAVNVAHETTRPGHRPSVYIIVDRDRRMPPAFTATFNAFTRAALPNFRVVLDEGVMQAQEMAQADWVMIVRASRIVPRYTFAPSSDNTLNGLTDCVADSGFLVGLALVPCLFIGDEDVLDATIRDARSRLVKRYHFEESAGGFTLFPPMTYLSNRNETGRWENLGNALFDNLEADGVFDWSSGALR